MSNVRRATTGGRRAAFVIVLHSMWRRAEGKFALIVLALWLLIAIVSLFWTPQSLWATDGYHVWAKPSAEHWLGTDGTGADVFSWLLAGSHTNLVIVLLTVVASMAWGLLLIAAMVARNAALASSSVVVVDALISVPTVLIALILAVPLGASIAVIVIACGFGYGLNLARVARPAALLASRSSYVESALANGASGWRVLISMLCRIFCRYWLCNCHCRRARRCWLSRGSLISVSVCRPVCRAGGILWPLRSNSSTCSH